MLLPAVFPEVSMYRDDAYYCFDWAKNVALGRGPVVSAGAPTTGVNVLWGLWLVLLSLLGGVASLEVTARWLGLFFHLLTGLLLGSSVRGSAVLRVALVCCYLSTPALLIEAQNGQETALGCLCLALLFRYRDASARVFVFFAVLLIAARSDLFFFVLALAVLRGASLQARARLVVIPLCCYVLWNLLIAGHPMQDSAKPMPWLFMEQFAAQGPSVRDYVQRYWWYGRPCLLGGPFAEFSAVASAVIYALAIAPWARGSWRLIPAGLVGFAYLIGMEDLQVPLLVAGLLWLRPLDGDAAQNRSAGRLAMALGIASIALVAAHEVVRFYPRDYYFAAIALAGYVVLGETYWRRSRWWILVLALGINTQQAFDGASQRLWQQPMAMAGEFVNRFVAPDQLIASFNSGIVSWHREGPVLNLDGVVNRPAFDALRAGRLDAYLNQQGVQWLLDNPAQFDRGWLPHANGRHFDPSFDAAEDLVLVASFVVPGVDAGRAKTGSFDLYWRREAGLRPPQLLQTLFLGPAPKGYGQYILWSGREGVTLRAQGSGRREDLVKGRAGVSYVICVPASFGEEFELYEGDAEGPLLRVGN